nr:hypothetical protein [Sphingomonas lycopersici]
MVERATPDPEFEALLRHIQESRGLDFRGYKRTSLRRRITLRMEAVNAENFAAYRAHLEAQPSEYEELLNTVLINVTSFFRRRSLGGDARQGDSANPRQRRGRSRDPHLERRLRER